MNISFVLTNIINFNLKSRMKSAIRERIVLILQTNHLSQTAFAKLSGLTQNTVNRQLNEATITCSLIEAVATQFPTVSMEWLIRGKGTMFASDTPSTTITNVSDSPIAINGSNITNPPSDSDALNSAMQLIHSQYDFIHQQSLLIAQLKGQLK